MQEYDLEFRILFFPFLLLYDVYVSFNPKCWIRVGIALKVSIAMFQVLEFLRAFFRFHCSAKCHFAWGHNELTVRV